MSDLKAVKKHAAQHDLFNRIHSVASDEQFVRIVAERWFNNRFKVVGELPSRRHRDLTSANQRCGTWYCDPAVRQGMIWFLIETDELRRLRLLQIYGWTHSCECGLPVTANPCQELELQSEKVESASSRMGRKERRVRWTHGNSNHSFILVDSTRRGKVRCGLE